MNSSIFVLYLFRSSNVEGKLSVVMNAFDRFDSMRFLIRRYATFKFVHKIYVVWGNVNVEPFPPSYFNVSIPVEILYYGRDNLNDRFRPIPTLETEAIMICDDDILLSESHIRFALETWKKNTLALVGFFPRNHQRNSTTGLLEYMMPRSQFSMVLTKAFILGAHYLEKYTCDLDSKVHEYVTNFKNCEDIAMNFLASQVGGLPPVYVYDPYKIDYGTSSGLSSRQTHDNSRFDRSSYLQKRRSNSEVPQQ